MIYKLNKDWDFPCWEIEKDLFVIYWSKTSEREKTDSEFKKVKGSELFFGNYVKHKEHGIGKIISRIFEIDNDYSFTMQTEDSKYDVFAKDVEKQVDSFQYVKVDPITRLFIIKQTGYKLDCYHYKNYKFVNHSVGDLNTIQEIVSLIAKEDSYLHLIESSAKWRSRPASDKQKDFIEKKIYSDDDEHAGYGIENLDIGSLTMGDASVLLDQIALYDLLLNSIKDESDYSNITFIFPFKKKYL